MSKGILFIITLVAAVALPVVTYYALDSFYQHNDAQRRYAHVKRLQADLERYDRRLAQYRQFADKAQRFVRRAEATGVAESGWNRHQVNIRERPVPFTALGRFLSETRNSEHSYFIPERLGLRIKGFPTDGVLLTLDGEFLVSAK